MAGIDKYAKIVLHGESLTDSSKYNVAITNHGVVSSGAKSKFGGKSLYFDGASYLEFPKETIIYGSKDFTVDWWENCEEPTAESGGTRYTNNATDTWGGFCIGSAKVKLWMGTSANNFDIIYGSSFTDYTVGSWVHWAVVRHGNKLTSYKNGVKFLEEACSGAIWTPNSGHALGIQGTGTPRNFKGYIDEFRISDFARWAGNFTPPTEAYSPGPDPIIPPSEDGQYCLVNGTLYKIDGGKAMVQGTTHEIDKGRAFVQGTAYDISFAQPQTLTVFLSYTPYKPPRHYIGINGAEIPFEYDVESVHNITIGDTLDCRVLAYDGKSRCSIYLDDVEVASRKASVGYGWTAKADTSYRITTGNGNTLYITTSKA